MDPKDLFRSQDELDTCEQSLIEGGHGMDSI